MTLKEKIMPALVLMIICIVISGLVIGVYSLTYVDNTGVMTDALKDGCNRIFSDKEATYEIILEESGDGKKVPITFSDDVTAVIVDKENKTCVFEIVADGYEKGGLHVLVGINSDGAVEGISFIEISETKGLGTKVQDESFLSGFKGFTSDSDVSEVDNLTGATFSSKGMKNAVSLALKTYSENKEAIFGE